MILNKWLRYFQLPALKKQNSNLNFRKCLNGSKKLKVTHEPMKKVVVM